MIHRLEATGVEFHRLAADRRERAFDFKVVNGMGIAQDFVK